VTSNRDDRLFGRALTGLALAGALWPFVFRSRWSTFWTRMTLGAGFLALYALRARPELRHERPAVKDLARGGVSAAGLYVIFQLGDRMASRIMPAGEEEIASIYRLRTAASRPVIATLLVTVIGPGEEFFWRGLVQHAFMRRFGDTRGTLAASAAYGAVHLASGNLTLSGAAATAGVYWGAEYALRRRLGPLLVSHVLWDLWIFLVAPTPGGKEFAE